MVPLMRIVDAKQFIRLPVSPKTNINIGPNWTSKYVTPSSKQIVGSSEAGSKQKCQVIMKEYFFFLTWELQQPYILERHE